MDRQLDSETTEGSDEPLLVSIATSPAIAGASPTTSSHVRDLYILSTSFLLVFLAYGATQNLESSLNSDSGLGSVTLGVLYLALTFFSIGAPLFVRWLGSRYGLLVGLSGYWIFMFANIFPSWYTMIPAAVFLGFTAALLWVAEGTYITSAAKHHALDVKMETSSAIGKFNGVFWGFFATNQVIGNLISLVLLKFNMGSTSTLPLLITFLGFMSVGTCLACFLRPQANTSKPDEGSEPLSLGNFRSATLSVLIDKRLLLLLALLIYSGLQQAFIWGDFTENVITPSLGISLIGGVMAAFGAADAGCSVLAGRLSSGISSAFNLIFLGATAQFIVLVSLAIKQSYKSDTEGYLVLFVLAIMWGLGDAAFNTQISVLLGILFPTDTAAAFAQWKIWQSAATALIFFITSSTVLMLRLILLLVVLFVSIFSLSVLRFTILSKV